MLHLRPGCVSTAIDCCLADHHAHVHHAFLTARKSYSHAASALLMQWACAAARVCHTQRGAGGLMDQHRRAKALQANTR